MCIEGRRTKLGKTQGGLQWRSEGNWRPGAKFNFAPPPQKKILKNDIEMSIVFN